MSDFTEKAISGEDRESFDQMRKLTACGLVLEDDMPPDEAAAQADKGIFQKTVEYAVGRGEMAADAAVEAMIDRQTCVFSTFIHKAIETCVTTACTVAGTFIGKFFGPAGIEKGLRIGAKIAGILNTNLSPFIDEGIEKIKDVAMTVYQIGKEVVKSAGQKIKNFFFG